MPGIALSGTIGSRLLDEALSRGHSVTAVLRDPSRLTRKAEALEVRAGDVLIPGDVTRAAAGHDVVISAVGGGDGPGHPHLIEPSARSLVKGRRALSAKAPRLIMVSGAGSLESAPGQKVWDAPGLPEFVRQIMHAHGDALAYLKTVGDVTWPSLSPAGSIAPGIRTGLFRTGQDKLIVDAEGQSAMSAEDYAVALLDEVENPRHLGERFTVAY